MRRVEFNVGVIFARAYVCVRAKQNSRLKKKLHNFGGVDGKEKRPSG